MAKNKSANEIILNLEYENLKKLQYENQNNINCYKRNRDEISLFLDIL